MSVHIRSQGVTVYEAKTLREAAKWCHDWAAVMGLSVAQLVNVVKRGRTVTEEFIADWSHID